MEKSQDFNQCYNKDSSLCFRDYQFIFFFFFLDFIDLSLESGKEGEGEGERHQYVVASHVPPVGDQAHNPGICRDWESNQRLFGSQARIQSTEPHRPRSIYFHKSY